MSSSVAVSASRDPVTIRNFCVIDAVDTVPDAADTQQRQDAAARDALTVGAVAKTPDGSALAAMSAKYRLS